VPHEARWPGLVPPSRRDRAAPHRSSPYIVFHERVQTTKIYIRDCSPVPPLAILLFGGGELVQGADGLLSVDDWLSIAVPAEEARLVLSLRKRLDDVLNRMVHRRAGDFGGTDHAPLIDALSVRAPRIPGPGSHGRAPVVGPSVCGARGRGALTRWPATGAGRGQGVGAPAGAPHRWRSRRRQRLPWRQRRQWRRRGAEEAQGRAGRQGQGASPLPSGSAVHTLLRHLAGAGIAPRLTRTRGRGDAGGGGGSGVWAASWRPQGTTTLGAAIGDDAQMGCDGERGGGGGGAWVGCVQALFVINFSGKAGCLAECRMRAKADFPLGYLARGFLLR